MELKKATRKIRAKTLVASAMEFAQGLLSQGYSQFNERVRFERSLRSQVRYDDLRFPASGINPPGPENAPTRNTETGLLNFANNFINIVAIQVQMPHTWKIGTAIRPHVHWTKATAGAGNVHWRMRYVLSDVGGVVPNLDEEPNWLDAIRPAVFDDNTAAKHLISNFPAIDMTGHGLSVMVNMFLERVGNAETDTYSGAASLLEFDIHYEVDGFGSEEPYVKEDW